MVGKQTTRQRMERMVSERGVFGRADHWTGQQVVKLLLTEHRRLRAKVRALIKQVTKEHIAYFGDVKISTAYSHVCDDLLRKLKAMR